MLCQVHNTWEKLFWNLTLLCHWNGIAKKDQGKLLTVMLEDLNTKKTQWARETTQYDNTPQHLHKNWV